MSDTAESAVAGGPETPPVMGEKEAPVFADNEELLTFTDEVAALPPPTPAGWPVMIVDDEPEIHHITMLSLAEFAFQGRPLRFINAYSGQEARQLIQAHPDTALILLDVVMETD